MDYSQFKDILFERRDNGILWITLNRPDKFNAADAAMHQAFVEIWHQLHHASKTETTEAAAAPRIAD